MEQSGSLTELEFRVTDPAYPSVRGSEVGDCEVVLEALLPQSEGYLEFSPSATGRPREVTGGELADQLDIALSTFGQHLRVAQRKVLSTLFEEPVRGVAHDAPD